jgi:hypothetical protein
MALQIGLQAIVVEQCVVDIEQERHLDGSCHPSPPELDHAGVTF